MAKVYLPDVHRTDILRKYIHFSNAKGQVTNYIYKDGYAYLPLNMPKLNQVADILGEKIEDCRSHGLPIKNEFVVNPSFIFRPHQEAPAKELLTHILINNYGVLRAPCSCGKTVVMTWVAGHLGKKTLVLVDQGNLAGQWKDAYQLVWNHEAHILDKKGDLSNDVVIATFQLLHKHPELMRDMREMFGTCLIDEFHTTGAVTYRKVLFKLSNIYRIGTSATVMRKGFSSDILTDLVAPISVDMVDEKALVPEVRFIDTEVEICSNNPDDFTSILTDLSENDARNLLIIDLLREMVGNGRKVLVIGARIKCLEYLRKRISEFCSVVRYTGSTTLEQDKALRDGVQNGSIDVVLTDKKAEKGLDIPRLDTVIVAKMMNNEATITQIAGRVLRPFAGKPTPLIIDLVDTGPLAYRFATNRYWWYKKLKYTFDKPNYWFLSK